MDGKPEFSVSDGKGKIYVNLEDKSCVAQINPITCKVEHVWPLAPGEGPSGLALDNQAAVDGIEEPSLNPITRLASFFRSTEDIPVETDVDDSKLQPTLASHSAAIRSRKVIVPPTRGRR